MIEGGTGRGYKAKANSRNQLEVRSTTVSEEHDIALVDGQAYFANSATTANSLTTATGNTYNMLYLENNSATRILTVEKVLTSANTAGGVWVWRKNMTVGTITNANTHSPVNTNFASGNSADVVCYN